MKSFIRTCALAAAVCAMPAMAVPYIDLGTGQNGRMGWGNIGVPAEGTHFTFNVNFGVYVFGAETPPSQTFIDLTGKVGSVTGANFPSAVAFSAVHLMSGDGLQTYETVALSQAAPELSFSFARLAAGQSYKLAFVGEALPRPSDDPDFFWGVREWGYSATAAISTAAISSPAPEASSLLMAAVGVAGVMAWSRRKQRKAATLA